MFHVLIQPPNLIIYKPMGNVLEAYQFFYTWIAFFRGNRDVCYKIARGDIYVNPLRRVGEGLHAYFSLKLHDLKLWDNTQEVLLDFPRRLTGEEPPHITLCYDMHFRSWADFHICGLKMESLMGSLEGREQWGVVNLSLHNHKVLVVGDRSSLFGLCCLLQQQLPEETAFNNFHITLRMH